MGLAQAEMARTRLVAEGFGIDRAKADHSASVNRISEGLQFLGIDIDPRRNAAAPGPISSATSGVAVHVIPTDEARVIARDVRDLMARDACGQEGAR